MFMSPEITNSAADTRMFHSITQILLKLKALVGAPCKSKGKFTL